MVGGDAVHVFGLRGDATEKIAPADNDRDLDAEGVDIGQLGRDFMDARRFHAEALVCCQRFAGEFQQNAFEDWCSHVS